LIKKARKGAFPFGVFGRDSAGSFAGKSQYKGKKSTQAGGNHDAVPIFERRLVG